LQTNTFVAPDAAGARKNPADQQVRNQAGEQQVRADGNLVSVGNRFDGLCFIDFVQPIVVANSASSCTGQHCR